MTNFNLNFLNTWNNLTSLEIEGIEVLKKGMKIIFEEIPLNDIICIYLKGSFLRREMTPKSDVDVVVIVKNKSSLVKLNQLQNDLGNSEELNFGFSGYTINELRTGQLLKDVQSSRSGTPRFTRMIPTYQLLYGEKLNLKTLYQKTEIELFKSLLKAFENIFLPNYKENKIDFDMLLKQSLWLFELEVAVRNKNYKFINWENLTEYLNENHLINETLKLRNSEKRDKGTKESFVSKLKSYLKYLNEEFN